MLATRAGGMDDPFSSNIRFCIFHSIMKIFRILSTGVLKITLNFCYGEACAVGNCTPQIRRLFVAIGLVFSLLILAPPYHNIHIVCHYRNGIFVAINLHMIN